MQSISDAGGRGTVGGDGSSSKPVAPQDRMPPGVVVAAAQERRQPSARRQRVQDDTEDDELDMTPMIDMTFLLLIFFMVASTMNSRASADLPPSVSGAAIPTEGRVELIVQLPEELSVDTTQPGAPAFDPADLVLSFADAPDKRIAWSDLEQALTQRFARNPSKKFVLHGHRKLPSGVVTKIVSLAKVAGATEIAVGVANAK